MDIMTQVADYHIKSDSARNIILDGRTFMKKEQVDALIAYGCHYDWDLRFIYCTCSDDVARMRLENDVADGSHPAADRDFDMYARLKSQADKLEVPHLHVDTGEPLESCVRQCLDYLSTDPKL